MSRPDPAFEALLEHLRTTRGFDFTGYKRASLMRRIDRRMAQLGVHDYGDYVDRLELHAEEFTALFNMILINVTGFFRDSEAWELLREQVLPKVVKPERPAEPIRIWSAGCASGQEAYTLAMVLAEMLGPAEFRSRVKIYATDVDDEALAQARQGAYTDREVQGVPPDLLDRYFERAGGRYVFRKDLRRSLIFGRNDLVQDAPISRIDLLVCRNTLMYFTAEAQARILTKFHFGLADAGVLFLGKAERLLSHSALFVPIDLKRRTFHKAPRAHVLDAGLYADPPAAARAELPELDALRNEAMLTVPMPHVVVTADGLLAQTNRQAEMLFGVSRRDVGRPFHDLDVSYRPLELRPGIEQAKTERRTVRVSGVIYARGPEITQFDVQVSPLIGADHQLLGVGVTFHDVTDFRRLQDELEQANLQLETAYEELQSTNEELETTNEELQSTVEELETTNEELQSTNEELETTNEELQSINDELHSINDELQDRTGELDRTNGFLETILTSLSAGVVVLDPDLHVQVWNRQAQELWGLRAEEAVGQHFLNLDIGLPTGHLRPMIRNVLSDGDQPAELSVAAVNRRGRTIDVRVGASALHDKEATVGVIITMEGVDRAHD
ncbi:MAG TPA: CheR family methyltransferase [Pseudonocardia sp.]